MNKYVNELVDLDLQFQEYPNNFTHGHYICAPYLKDENKKPQVIIKKLREQQINSRTIYDKPNYAQPAYQNLQNWRWAKAGITYPDYSKINLPITEKIAKSHFELPIHPGLTEENIDYVISSLKKILKD